MRARAGSLANRPAQFTAHACANPAQLAETQDASMLQAIAQNKKRPITSACSGAMREMQSQLQSGLLHWVMQPTVSTQPAVPPGRSAHPIAT
jgi:hypothetical protein